MTGILDHVTVCDDVVLVQRAGVANDVKEPGTYAGTPIQPIKDYIKIQAARAPPRRSENGNQGAQGPPGRPGGGRKA